MSFESLDRNQDNLKNKENQDNLKNKENQKSNVETLDSTTVNNGSDNTDLDEWLTNAFQKHLEKVFSNMLTIDQ